MKKTHDDYSMSPEDFYKSIEGDYIELAKLNAKSAFAIGTVYGIVSMLAIRIYADHYKPLLTTFFVLSLIFYLVGYYLTEKFFVERKITRIVSKEGESYGD